MWKRSQADVIAGAEEWLPAIDWPSMKVFRIEAALKPPLRGARARGSTSTPTSSSSATTRA